MSDREDCQASCLVTEISEQSPLRDPWSNTNGMESI
jgi:hypothetical protein